MVYGNPTDFFVGIGLCALIIVAAILLLRSYSSQETLRYRKYLTNLYVSGRVRQLAGKDDVDLSKEEKEFLKYESQSNKKRVRDLDDKIEQELINKIEKETKTEGE